MQKFLNYETFEHKADIGIRGFGKTLDKAFENAARAMFSVMVDLEKVRPQEKVFITCEGVDEESLLLEWLNALLAEADLKDLVFSEFEVEIANNNLAGVAGGEKIDLKKHELRTEVKGATYSQLKVKKENNRWVAQCIVDV